VPVLALNFGARADISPTKTHNFQTCLGTRAYGNNNIRTKINDFKK